MQRFAKRLAKLTTAQTHRLASSSFAKKFDSFQNDQFTPENHQTKSAFEASFRESKKSAGRKKASQGEKKAMGSKEMPPTYFENEK